MHRAQPTDMRERIHEVMKKNGASDAAVAVIENPRSWLVQPGSDIKKGLEGAWD